MWWDLAVLAILLYRILQASSSHFMSKNGFLRSFAEALTYQMGQFIAKSTDNDSTVLFWLHTLT